MAARKLLEDHCLMTGGDDLLTGDDILNELLNLDNSDIDFSDDEQEIHPSFENAEQLRQLLDDEPDDSDADPDFDPGLVENNDSSNEDDEPTTSQRKRKKTTSLPKAKPNSSKTKKDKGPAWKVNTFEPDPIFLIQPAYKPVLCDDWDDDKFIIQYIDDDLLNKIVEKTNQTFVYSVGKSLQLTINELKVWLGITCIMSALQYPKIRMYWEKKYRVPIISGAMSRDRYFIIRKSIKVVFDNDISQEAMDRIWKIRPLVNRVLKGCLEQIRDQEICIDEMMIPFSGNCGIKQYVPNKPNPVGLKVFVLANPSGIVCDFIVYQGKTTFPEEVGQGFSLGESAVVHLSKTLVPGHIIYIDRYFTTVKLADELMKRGIRCTGTIKKNQIPRNNDLPDDKTFKKRTRGSTSVSVREDGLMACTKWLDNKPVTLLSTNESQEPEITVRRWSKAERKYIDVKQPKVINSYNRSMGGVDLSDRMLSVCPARSRTRKWTVRSILHFIDLALVNSWLQMRNMKRESGVAAKDIPQFRAFKINYGERLVNQNSQVDSDSTTDSSSDEENSIVFEDGRRTSLPSVEKRTRGAKHIPKVHEGESQRCRNPKCSLKSTIYCKSCKVILCLKKKNNCFDKFHQK